MSAKFRKINRQVIPRWRTVAATALRRELDPLQRREPMAPPPEALTELELRTHEYRRTRSLSFAADLLGASIVVGPSEETLEAARTVLADRRAPEMVRATAGSLLEMRRADDDEQSSNDEPAPNPQHEIARLRIGLRSDPRNALRWCEMARQYAIEGHATKATHAMALATNLAPGDRYVLRSGIRLWVHLEEHDRARAALRAVQAAVLNDPWLLATEIASSALAGRSSRHLKHGRRLAEGGRHADFVLSELRGALATVELEGGNNRKARQLFRAALADPNENTVAQAEWASHHLAAFDVDTKQIKALESFEALARQAADRRDLDLAAQAAWGWLHDQPFSAEPAVWGSYWASMKSDFEQGAEFARNGLRANPRDSYLTNNLAFCLASADEWAKAEDVLRRIEWEDEDERASVQATWGLIRFRAGDSERGRQLYEEAIANVKSPDEQARAAIMLAAEEIRAKTPRASEAVARALALVARASAGDLTIWATRLR